MTSDIFTPAPHPDGCDGHGWVRGDDGDRPYAARCPGCEWARVFEAVGEFVPQRFRGRIPLPDPVAGWVTRGHQAEGLYLAGQVGTGKTHTAYMAMAAWCLTTGVAPRGAYVSHQYGVERRIPPSVVFVRATALFDELRPGGDSRQRIVDCQEADLLVLDDIGAEKPSEWTCEKLYEIVDERYVKVRPLIVTSNVPPSKLAVHLSENGGGGDRVASRFAELCTVVPMAGADRRRPR